MNKEVLIQKITSRKFLVTVSTALFIVLTRGLEIEVDKFVYDYLVGIAIAYITGESVVDVSRQMKN